MPALEKAGEVGDADELPAPLRATGFECAESGSRRLRLAVPVAFYRGTRAPSAARGAIDGRNDRPQ